MAERDGKKKKVLTVFGTRSDAIKMCPLVLELKSRASLETAVCVTAQHRELLDGVLSEFGVVPDYDLNVMTAGQELSALTASVMKGVDDVLVSFAPDFVLVHGDTTTAFAAALAAFYRKIPVGHVEAGLRTGNAFSPYPEEFNRLSVGLIAGIHFAPTENAASNLLAEGKDPGSVFLTGNTVVDAMRIVSGIHDVRLSTVPEGSRFVFMTVHRRESLGEPMLRIFRAMRRVIEKNGDVYLLYPVHPNPAVRRIAEEELGNLPRVILCEPLSLAECHAAERTCAVCVTDSGGVQEECAILGKPVLVTRNVTERNEGIESGGTILVGDDGEELEKELDLILNDPVTCLAHSARCARFGDGYASGRIADVIETGKCDQYGK